MSWSWAPPQYRWTDLLNSDYHDYRGDGPGEDRLGADDWLAAFLELCGAPAGRLPGAAGRARMRRLRSVMAKVVWGIVANGAPRRSDLAALNRYLRLAAAHPRVELAEGRFVMEAVPSNGGLDRVIGSLARSLAETLANGEPERIKMCANPDCRWVMYDESRNRTRRWCEAGVCGNLVKVRQFRRRRADGGETPCLSGAR